MILISLKITNIFVVVCCSSNLHLKDINEFPRRKWMTLMMNALIYWTQALSFMSQLQGMPLWFKALHKTWNFISLVPWQTIHINIWQALFLDWGYSLFVCLYFNPYPTNIFVFIKYLFMSAAYIQMHSRGSKHYMLPDQMGAV